MRSNSKLIRTTDKKEFRVVELAHWSTIRAEDGEEDIVKWYGGDGYVGASSGHAYVVCGVTPRET